ncbi:hypothetical protein E2C01_026485 [Portunus trituberculatus]|uniref:Uncharacterized protein n=1 Tax=Portunus trituberculatus TaxID=210409 RepID=A0A5B7EJB9_PORTR|nr:hypothetical protein [Portunus trituberculatus]
MPSQKYEHSKVHASNYFYSCLAAVCRFPLVSLCEKENKQTPCKNSDAKYSMPHQLKLLRNVSPGKWCR